MARSLQNHIETRPFLEAQCVQCCDKAQLLHKHTHRSIQDTTHDPLAHMPCGPALCLLLHAFKVPRPLALCKAGLGHSELVYPYAFFGVSAHQRTLKGMKIRLQKITHLGGRLFFSKVLTSLLSDGNTVCSCILGREIKGMSEVTDFCHNGPRSTRVQAAFVKAMCGVLCAASQ